MSSQQVLRFFRKKKLSVYITLGVLVLLVLVLPLTIFLAKQQQETRQYAAAAGNTYFASPGDNLGTKISVLQPGDTLFLNDGTYANTKVNMQNIHGTATSPITIQAVHDGQAIIDGGGTSGGATDHGFYIVGDSYINFQGFVVRNDYGSNMEIGNSDHLNFRRISVWDAGMNNTAYFGHNFNVDTGSSNILVEDCAALGHGRYNFAAYHASNVIFRRDFAMKPAEIMTTVAPRSNYGVYGSTNVTLENVIGINTIPTQTDDNYYTATWETTDDPTNFPTTGTQVLGSMFYNNCEGFWVNGGSFLVQNTTFKDDYFDIPVNSACQQFTTKPYGEGMHWDTTYGGSVTNSTFTNNKTGFERGGSGTPQIANNVFMNNTTAFQSDPGHSYADFWNNGALGTTLTATDKQVNPGYDTATYGRGAYLFVPQSSPLKGTGQNGADIGANILYEYVDGLLTTTPLWPWPMEDRIMAEKGISVTYAANGGIWKTLNGVYPNATITPSSTPSGTPVPSDTLTPTPIVPTPTPTLTPLPTPTNTPFPTPTSTPIPTPTFTPVPTPTNTPIPTSTPLPTSTPIAVSTDTPTPVPPTPVPTPAPDTTPPTVAITSPLNGATVKPSSKITITASASDNVGVTQVNILVNGTLLCTDTFIPYSCVWSVPGKKNVTYTIVAQAYDGAGNAASNSIQVTAGSSGASGKSH